MNINEYTVNVVILDPADRFWICDLNVGGASSGYK